MYTVSHHRSIGLLLSMLIALLIATTFPQAASADEHRLATDIGALHGLGPTSKEERESFKATLREWRKNNKKTKRSGVVREAVWEGTPELIIADQFDDQGKPVSSETRLMLHTKDAVLRVFPLTDLPDLRKGNLRIRVQGIAAGDRVLSESLSVTSVAAAPATTVTAAATATTAPPCQPTGPQRGLVIGVTYSDIAPTPNNSLTALRDGFFGATNSVANYWNVVSYGKTTLTGNTVGWLKLPINFFADGSNTPHVCKLAADGKYFFDIALLETEALKAAANAVDIDSGQSIDLTQYNRIFIAHDKSTNICSGAMVQLGWGGSCMTKNTSHGAVNASTDWDGWGGSVSHELRVGIAMHEAGHSLGLGHADMLRFPDLSRIGPIGSLPPSVGYGDGYDVMGFDLRGHFNAHHQFQLGWLTPDNVINVNNNVNGSSYLIEPISKPMSSPTAKKALRVFRGVDTSRIVRTDPNSIYKDYLWVETRSNAGYDALNPTGVSTAWGNVLIHHEVAGRGAHHASSGTLLVDMVPGGSSNDAPLLLNQEFYDPYGKIYIYNAGAINDNLNVSVVYAKFDTDTDGLPDAVEPSYGANPTLEDTDGDGLTDLWEVCYDGDCSSYSPYPIGRDLHPDSQDTDGDGMLDKTEVEKGFSPIVPGQPPTITEFTPASGNAGTFIIITGTNFPSRGASENVSISFHPGVPALIAQPFSSSQILVLVPVGATTGPITISTFWGSATSTAAFIIQQPPTITSFNPTGAPPGTLVEISGTNFIPGGGTTVTLNGTPTVSSLSGDYRLYFFVPTGATTGKIKVTTVYGSVDSLTDFIVPSLPICLPITQVLTLGDGTGPTNEEVKVTFFGQIANAAAFTTNPTTSRVLKVCPDTQVQYAATATKGTLVCSINNNQSQPNGTLRINDKLTCSNRSGGGGDDVDTFYVKPQ